MTNIEFDKLTSTDVIVGEDEDETRELKELFGQAKQFLSSFHWCKRISESFYGLGVGGVVGVFLFKVEPFSKNVDEWLWVIVGDIPPAYIVTDLAPNPASALSAYVGEMKKWTKAVNSGEPVSGLIPVNAPADREFAEMLQKRLLFLEQNIIPNSQQ